MASRYQTMAKRLQAACNNNFDSRILISREQFYSMQQERPVTFFVITKAIPTGDNNRPRYIELFSSASEISIVKYMRDYWFDLNGWEIPKDKHWEKEKERYYSKH